MLRLNAPLQTNQGFCMPNWAYQLPGFKAVRPQLPMNILHNYM